MCDSVTSLRDWFRVGVLWCGSQDGIGQWLLVIYIPMVEAYDVWYL